MQISKNPTYSSEALLGFETVTVQHLLSLLPIYFDAPLEIKVDRFAPTIALDNIWPFASDYDRRFGVGVSGRTAVGQPYQGMLKYSDWIFVSSEWYDITTSAPKPKPAEITSEMAPAELLHSLHWSEDLCQEFMRLKAEYPASERLLALKQGFNIEIPVGLYQVELISGTLFVDETLPYAYESLKMLPHTKLFKLFQQYWLQEA